MKTSNKILLISNSCLIVVMIVFLLVFRSTLESSITPVKSKDLDKSMVSHAFSLADFTEIEVSGHWGIELTRGEMTQVKVTAPKDVMETLSVQNKSGTLILKTGKRRRHSPGKAIARITVPTLSALHLRGLVSLELNGFRSENLTVYTAGATSIMGKGNHIINLYLRGEGLSRLNLNHNSVVNADLRYKGVYKIELSMAGGELTGRIKGVGKVIYDGEIRKEKIRKYGASKVIKSEKT